MGAIVDRVHFSFRPDGSRFTAGDATRTVVADARGIDITPIHPRADREPSRSVRVELRAVVRGDRDVELSRAPRARVAPDGHLAIDRGEVVEHFHHRAEGVEQSWAFAREPAGDGSLRVTVDVRGAAHVADTPSGIHFADASSGLGLRYGHGLWVDASGQETRIPARWRGDRIELVVPSDVVGAATYPAVLDPVISPEVGLDTPVLSPTSGTKTDPAIASNGSGYLVVWTETRADTPAVFATRVDASGTVLDPHGILVSGSTSSQAMPAVASDGTDYFVVWQHANADFDVYGARVTSAGAVLDPSGIAVHRTSSQDYWPSVAWNGSHYLVVWQRAAFADNNVLGIRVSRDGALLGSAFSISSATGVQSEPRVASNGTDFLVVWRDGRTSGEGDVYGARVSASGTVFDASGIALSTAAGAQLEVSVASNGTGYLVVWSDGRAGGFHYDVYATRVSAAGGVSDPGGIAISAGSAAERRPNVARAGSDYFVVWSDERAGGGTSVYGARVTSVGVVRDPGGLAISTRGATPTVATNGTALYVTWLASRPPPEALAANELYGTAVTLAGAPADPSGTRLGGAANAQRTPSVAYDGTSWLVAWADARGASWAVWGARVDPSGAVLDPSGIAISSGTVERRSPRVASDGEGWLVVWEEESSADASDVRGTRVTASGAVSNPSGIAISTASGAQTDPSAACDPARCLVVWTDARTSGGRDVYGTFVGASGAVSHPSGLGIATGGHAEHSPRAAFGASGYLVVYEDQRTSQADVYATFVSTAGAISDPSGFPIATRTEYENAPAVAASATSYFVVWSYGLADVHIRGTVVTSSGVSGPTPITIHAEAGSRGAPEVASDRSDYFVVWRDYRGGSRADVYGARIVGTSVRDASGLALATSPFSEQSAEIAAGPPGRFLLVYDRFVAEVPERTRRIRARLIDDRTPLGSVCGSSGDCASGHCVDGVCCDDACGGGATDCLACSVATGAPGNGACAALTGTACDDTNACTISDRCAAGSCGGANACDAATTCAPGPGATYACSACPAGTYSADGTGATACTEWTTCAPGTHVASAGSATRDRTCVACAGGYSSTTNAPSCTPWTDCVPGERESSAGTPTSDRVCVPCSSGWTSAPNAATCVAWTDCAAGQYVAAMATVASDRVCAACPAGTYSTSVNAPSCAACTACPPGAHETSACTATRDRVCEPEAPLDGALASDAGTLPIDAAPPEIDAGRTLDGGSPEAPGDAGCACRAARSGGNAGLAFVGMAIVLVAVRRRRRRRGADDPSGTPSEGAASRCASSAVALRDAERVCRRRPVSGTLGR
ncbi:putative lipoprotein [Sandaracinus amylolyticus]|uniref:Putative lipoprotein n=1 Tax=Sandaracinus amylolyticus TaxID=927083 RepID=A0A0F6YL08_9BACT|nr:putative lipoprotein [Sandaracinus amylolyticus]